MMDGQFWYMVISGLAGGGLGVLGAWRHFRRAFSADNTEIARNQAEVSILKTLQEQTRRAQDRADVAERERTDALIKVGELQGQLTVLNYRLEQVQHEMAETKMELHAARDEIRTLNVLLRQEITDATNHRHQPQ